MTGLDAQTAQLVEQFANAPATTKEQLRKEISTYLEELEAAATTHEFVDLETAMHVAAICHKLLDRSEGQGDSAHRLVQAAVRYFTLDEDAESDLHSPIGFDDDLRVAEAVARAIGAHDLVGEGA